MHCYDHINLLVMPTDACNMDCVYCFHKPYTRDFGKMSMETVKYLLDITAPYYKTVNLIWHGGEPLLMGLDFYREVMELQSHYSCKINNSMQSNLTLLTPEIADFLVQNNIDISGSFDGFCNEQSRGRSEDIISCRQLMIERGKRCGFIMVVSKLNIERLIESYLLFKKLDTNFSLNLYIDQKDYRLSTLRLERDKAIQRLNELFNYWAKDTTGNIHISYFKNILDFILFKKKTLCCYTSCLGRWLGVHFDGTLTPCNRYFPFEYSFGSVYDYTDIGEAFSSDGFTKLLKSAIERREKCKACDIYEFCGGGCNNVALNENGIENNGGLNCQILVAVYKYIESYIAGIKQEGYCNYNPLLISMLNDSTSQPQFTL